MGNRVWWTHVFWAGAGLTLVVPAALPQTGTTIGAQAYPAKPIRMIVTNPPGGGTDVVTRALVEKLRDTLGQPVVVDNRSGASGILGADMVAKSTPDGYTLVAISSQHTIIPSFFPKVPYDLVKDFAPVTQMTSQSYILGVYPGVPAKSVEELVALAKSKPGQLNYASGGNGTAPHLGGELFKILSGTNLVHIPYKGGAPAVLALIGGEVSMLLSSVPTTMPQVKAGRIRALALTSTKRAPAMPDLPTVAESVPGYEVISWYGVLAPAKTPRAIVAKLNAELVNVLRTPEIKERLARDGTEAVGNTPEAFADYIKAEIVKWAKVVKTSGAKMD